MSAREPIRLVIFDWAGTTVDHGCFGPVAPFVEALRRHGVTITVERARGPMGLDKKDHLRALLQFPEAATQWRAASGADVTEADVERIYREHVIPIAIESVPAASALIPGVLECVADLRSRGITIGTTTGYFTEAARLCYETGAKQGYVPDFNVCASEVAAARPAPWMMYRVMEALGVYPSSAVLKVGDTVPDIGEGLKPAPGPSAWRLPAARSASQPRISPRSRLQSAHRGSKPPARSSSPRALTT